MIFIDIIIKVNIQYKDYAPSSLILAIRDILLLIIDGWILVRPPQINPVLEQCEEVSFDDMRRLMLGKNVSVGKVEDDEEDSANHCDQQENI